MGKRIDVTGGNFVQTITIKNWTGAEVKIDINDDVDGLSIFAAAPDMLKALIAMDEYTHREMKPGDFKSAGAKGADRFEREQIWQMVRDAIKKALPALLLCFVIGLTACGNPADPEAACNVVPTQDLSKPGVLVIGDSISFGYTPYVKSALPAADVVHTFCNAETSTNGVHWIDRWLAYRTHWNVVTINHGLWDIPHNPGGGGTSLANYAYNLRYEVLKIQAHADHVIFVTTTSVAPEFTIFSNSTIDNYNQVAIDVMTSLGVEVLDLNAVSKTIPELHLGPMDVHFKSSGSLVLADAVTQAVAGAL